MAVISDGSSIVHIVWPVTVKHLTANRRLFRTIKGRKSMAQGFYCEFNKLLN